MRGEIGSLKLALIGLISTLGLCNCAGPDRRTALVPYEAKVEGASRIDLLVATTRQPSEVAGELFSGERGGLGFAEVAVSIPPSGNREVGAVQWPASSPPDPSRDFVTIRAERLERAEITKRFSNAVRAQKSRHVLVFVHGYNTHFASAVYGFAQFMNDSATPAVPMLFTWPSRASLLAYGYDRDSVAYSRDALEKVLRALNRHPDVREISVLAHSMGTWLTMETFRQMAIRSEGIPKKVNNLILAAPDIDVEVFDKQISLIGSRRPATTLFVSKGDIALAASRRLAQSKARLGAIDPDAEPYRTRLAALNVKAINLTGIKTDDRLGHSKFADSPAVVRFIGQRLASGHDFSRENERAGLFTTALNLTSDLTSAIVAAPLAIVDPASRRRLGQSVDNLTGKEE